MQQFPENISLRISEIKSQCSLIKPLVTISCGTFNQKNYIRETLDGFVMQITTFPFVVIVHDDASTDGTASIIKEYADKYPNLIIPIFESENQYSKGEGKLSNIMGEIRKATGAEYYAFCEGDDYWTNPLKLQKQYDILELHQDLSIALNRVGLINKNGEQIDGCIPPKDSLKEGIVTLATLMDEEFMKGNWTFHTSSFFIRKTVLEKYSEIRESVFNHFPYGDMPLLLNCLLLGNGYFFTEEMGYYRVLSGGYNSSLVASPQKAIAEFRQVATAYRDFDTYTLGKYHKQIERAARRYEWRAMKLLYPKKLLWRFQAKYFPFLSFKEIIRFKYPTFYTLVKSLLKHSEK
ncbi:MAG: glycosyltransferase [Bacteroides sp.]|nr:glycosyltransferase [Bacteroides sp.]MBD5376025.1 glycosyltransferase [Bacteroides sp.]